MELERLEYETGMRNDKRIKTMLLLLPQLSLFAPSAFPRVVSLLLHKCSLKPLLSSSPLELLLPGSKKILNLLSTGKLPFRPGG